MTITRLMIASTIAAIAGGNMTALGQAPPSERCFGVSKAGKNDCQTARSSCAGTAKKDAQGDAWIAVPKGTCEKLVGGSLTEKKG